MFLTITIDTHQKKAKKMRFNKNRINPAKGWRMKAHFQKRGLWQRFKQWKKSVKPAQYKLGEQKVMF